MSTLFVHLDSEAQEKAVKAVLEALQINFKQEMDETELGEKDIKAGKGVASTLNFK